MKKYPKIRRPGHSNTEGLFRDDDDQLVITEKFDGNNVRVSRDGDELQFGSRNTNLGTDPGGIGGMFDDVTDYLSGVLDADDFRNLERYTEAGRDVSVTLFGENAVQHTIKEYVWEEVPQFQLFDIYADPVDGDGYWFTWDVVELVANDLGLETVPVVEKTTVGEIDLDEFEVPESAYRDDGGPAEGVVFRNEDTGVKAKYISDEFAERHNSAKQGKLVDPDDDSTKLVAKYATRQRIRKNIAKLLEEPDNDYEDLEMELMADLHLKVWRDVWAEEYEEIIATGWTLDLSRTHNLTANKCARVLQDLIQAGESPVTVVEPETGETLDADDYGAST